MKRSIYIAFVSALLIAIPVLTSPVSAQEPPHPPTSGHGSTGNQSPMGPSAPIDGGLSIMLALGIGYGIKKRIQSVQE